MYRFLLCNFSVVSPKQSPDVNAFSYTVLKNHSSLYNAIVAASAVKKLYFSNLNTEKYLARILCLVCCELS